ncbi:uncharacterized protein LOC135502337 [Lineus longissimus]|uniref:uncharacterized protein LOC135502337 n=1 Tax=Lineus longissimus TaxID=88925 RepID=UPI002B4D3AE1
MAMGQDKKEKAGVAPSVEDRSRMIMDVAPGRKGCTSVFPWGGSIKVPPGLFGKKDNLIAKMISPCERHLHAPQLRDTEKLLSEVFLFVARNYEFDKLLTVEFPVYDENLDLFEMRLKVKKSGDQDWVTLDNYVYNAKTKMVTFETKSLGVFAVTSTPKAEKFELTQNGCLYSARINRYISLRFPKRAVDRTVRCEIRIHKVTQEKIEITQRDHGNECFDVVAASNFYDISFPENEAMTFKRAASIKLPLVLVGEDEPLPSQKQETEVGEDGDHEHEEEVELETGKAKQIDLENLCVLHKTEAEGWTLIETPLKFTRTTVQFDVKCLGKFILVQTKPGLPKHRLKFALPFIEEQNLKIKGEILTFVYKEKKHWRMMFDVVDKEYAEIITQERKEAGWSFIEKLDLTEKPVEDLSNTRGYGRRRAAKEQKKEDPELKLLNLHNGSTYNIGITGDFKLADSTPDDRLVLQFHEKLTDNYTYFDVVPAPPAGWHWDKDKNKVNGVIEKQNGEVNEKETKENKENIENGLENGVAETETKTFTGTISCFSNDSEQKRLLRKYNVQFSEEDFMEYLKPEYVEPEPEKEKPKLPSVVIVDPAQPTQPKPVKYKTFTSPQFTRLTKPTRPVIRISREAKVLSGRSLQILSREVEQGLTLAVHLNLPDSTITGIGFDSLSNGMSLVDVTYKVLLHWKRLYKGDKALQVEQLVSALKEMGRFDVAAVIMDRHRQGVELSSDCFKY